MLRELLHIMYTGELMTGPHRGDSTTRGATTTSSSTCCSAITTSTGAVVNSKSNSNNSGGRKAGSGSGLMEDQVGAGEGEGRGGGGSGGHGGGGAAAASRDSPTVDDHDGRSSGGGSGMNALELLHWADYLDASCARQCVLDAVVDSLEPGTVCDVWNCLRAMGLTETALQPVRDYFVAVRFVMRGRRRGR